jgi:hypothetical protein
MSILCYVVDLLLTTIVAIDTLGLVNASRKDSSSVTPQDVYRLCLVWASFAILNSLQCCSCGIIGSLIGLIALGAKVWIALPKLGGANKVQTMIENGQFNQYAKSLIALVKSKVEKIKAE